MTDDEHRPIEVVMPGQTIHPPPDGWTPIEAFVLVKCMDETGDSARSVRTTNPLNLEELLGTLTGQVDLVKQRLVDAREDEDDEAPC